MGGMIVAHKYNTSIIERLIQFCAVRASYSYLDDVFAGYR
jgi:hypothetical protein